MSALDGPTQHPGEVKQQVRILVIEDEKRIGEFVARGLESAGYTVESAEDGASGLERLHATEYDLIILDLHMPVLDGFGAFRELRGDERFTATPIVALTASAMQGDRELALSAGFTGYLAKPISLHVLRREIDRLLGEESPYVVGA